MFLQLSHTQLPVFVSSKSLVLESYRVTGLFPPAEKFAMTHQIRRAALSVLLNVAEGCSRKSSAERKRFYEVARGSLIEVDTAIDIANELHYCSTEQVKKLSECIISTFKQLTGLIGPKV